MSSIIFYCLLIGMFFHTGMVWGDTFIETFSTNRIQNYLTEKEEDYRHQPLPDFIKNLQLPNQCYLFNAGEFKYHNVTSTYAKQTIIKQKDDGKENIEEVPMSPRLFPTKPQSTPVHINLYIVPHLKTNTFHDLRLSYSSSVNVIFLYFLFFFYFFILIL
ncbi:hypothetical protein BCR36DRAFT_131193 [Piromyces finnis]|uniref:Uncharacterized protein n=1 Tax=Piromyces finnis TaxID=1754191 RepID=A0A1Y1UZR8_9FUNG|nr:hypothetical protein BCR36DRAFT_131193 [Piromyces finnis]|eukprot:ORX44048.1 hypothetical protein BCR36DRAFT_131193 [Piromyces finnis]